MSLTSSRPVTTPTTGPRRWRLSSSFHCFSYFFLGASSLFSVFFLCWMALASLKRNRDLFKLPLSLPDSFAFGNYAKVWIANQFATYFLNSLLVVSCSVLVLLLVAVPAAYILSRATFRGRNLLTNFLIMGMAIPVPLLFVPLFVLLSNLHLADTLTGLSLIYVALSIPFTVYVMTGFFSSLPAELEAAAMMDGCSDFQIFWRIMLPLAMPGVATVALLNFVWLWNEYQLALVLLNSPENRTLSLGIYALINAMQYSGGDWAGLFAGVTIVTLPTIVLYLFLSERMIGGLTMGGVK